jgi:hypothetical protein
MIDASTVLTRPCSIVRTQGPHVATDLQLSSPHFCAFLCVKEILVNGLLQSKFH